MGWYRRAEDSNAAAGDRFPCPRFDFSCPRIGLRSAPCVTFGQCHEIERTWDFRKKDLGFRKTGVRFCAAGRIEPDVLRIGA
jgi:hypothetical protein